MLDIVLGNIKLDQFKDESIVITDSIQNVQDFQKIFTEYSDQFTLPATQVNNEAFKNYYNFDIVNGFDARTKKPCKLLLNGVVKYDGYLQLNSVELKNKEAINYKVYFNGKTAKIKDIIKNDKLQDLTYLSNYDHEYNITNVREGLQNELFSGVIKYPFIGAVARFISNSNNLKRVESDGTISSQSAIYNEDFKPAIQLIEVIKAIEAQYDDIEFSRTFFGSSFFSDLYLWLHRGKGRAVVDFAKATFNRDNLVNQSGNLFTYPVDGIFRIVEDPNNVNPVVETDFLDVQTYDEINLLYTITVNGDFTYKIVDELTGNLLATGTGDDTASVQSGLTLIFEGSYKPVLIVTTQDENVTTITASLDIECIDNYLDNSGQKQQDIEVSNWQDSQAAVSDFIIQDQIPEMKVIDFITSLFKMFNLTAYIDNNNIIQVLPLDDFYRMGKDIEISNQIDIEKSEVRRVDTFNEINFKFENSETIFRDTFNQENGRVYGDLEFNVSQTLGDINELASLKPYNVQVGFDKLLYTDIQNIVGASQGYKFGAAVDQNNESVKIKPLILCMKNITIPTLTFEGDGSNTTISSINEPRNFTELSTGIFQSINFGEEILGVEAQTLYNLYYENYIRFIFNPKTRIVKLKARLRNDVLLNYKLSDNFIIDGRRYKINQLKHNYLTGVSDLELMNDNIKLDALFIDPQTVSFDNGVNSQLINVTSSVDWLVDNLPSWLTVDTNTGSNNGSFTITSVANSTTEQRNANVTITGGGITQVLEVSQLGSFLNITGAINFGPDASSQNLNIVSNVSWSLSGLPSWLTANTTSGTGDGVVVLTATDNNTGSQRTATLEVTGSGLTRQSFITQSEIQISVNPTSQNTGVFGGVTTIDLFCNSDWVMQSKPSWVSVTPTSGVGNESVTINVQPNNTGANRSGTVVFSASGVLAEYEINQLG